MQGNNHHQMTNKLQPELLPVDTNNATFKSESEKLQEFFNDPTMDVERFIEQQEIKHQLSQNA